MWTVFSDVGRGRSRYTPLVYSRIGPRSVQWLRDALKSSQKATRLAAVQTLGAIGHDRIAAVSDLARPAIPDLIHVALKDQDHEVRIFAAVSLGRSALPLKPRLSLLSNCSSGSPTRRIPR